MRRLLGVLREDERATRRSRGSAACPTCSTRRAPAGTPVELSEEGERPQLSPGLDLTVYRIVQEALTNARKHAGGGPTAGHAPLRRATSSSWTSRTRPMVAPAGEAAATAWSG